MTKQLNTVKGHSREHENVFFMSSFPLYTGSNYIVCALFINEKNVAAFYRQWFSFPVVDWFCLFIDLWVLNFPLEDCSVFGNFVITLIQYTEVSFNVDLTVCGNLHLNRTPLELHVSCLFGIDRCSD